jgi:DNA replication protein DnaD
MNPVQTIMDVGGRRGKRETGQKKQYNKQTKKNNADA